MKQNKLDFLGIPSCLGFGLHADSYRFVILNPAVVFHVFHRLELHPSDSLFFYRFLVFPNMGQSLQSVMEEEEKLLSETAVLHLACRIVGVAH